MKCWKCGTDNTEGATKCLYCGAEMKRTACKTEEGEALRKLYDQFGPDAVFAQKNFLTNGLGDYLQDSSKLRNQIRMVMDAGIGDLYLKQLKETGKPDADFSARAKKIIVDDAGLSEQTSDQIMSLFDEMIGWKSEEEIKPKEPPKASVQKDVFQQAMQKDLEPFDTEKPKRSSKVIIWIIALLVILIGGLLIINQSQGWIPVPWATATPSPTPTPTPTPTEEPDPVAIADYDFRFAVYSNKDNKYIRYVGKDTTNDKLEDDSYYTICMIIKNNSSKEMSIEKITMLIDKEEQYWNEYRINSGESCALWIGYKKTKTINDGYHTCTVKLDGKTVYSNRFVSYESGSYVIDEYNAKGENTYHRDVKKTVEYELAYAVDSISKDEYIRHVGIDTSIDTLGKDEYYALYATIHNNSGKTIEYKTSTLKVDDISLSWASFSVESGKTISLRFYYDQMKQLAVGKHTCILELNGKKVQEWTFNVQTKTPEATSTPTPTPNVSVNRITTKQNGTKYKLYLDGKELANNPDAMAKQLMSVADLKKESDMWFGDVKKTINLFFETDDQVNIEQCEVYFGGTEPFLCLGKYIRDKDLSVRKANAKTVVKKLMSMLQAKLGKPCNAFITVNGESKRVQEDSSYDPNTDTGMNKLFNADDFHLYYSSTGEYIDSDFGISMSYGDEYIYIDVTIDF